MVEDSPPPPPPEIEALKKEEKVVAEKLKYVARSRSRASKPQKEGAGGESGIGQESRGGSSMGANRCGQTKKGGLGTEPARCQGEKMEAAEEFEKQLFYKMTQEEKAKERTKKAATVEAARKAAEEEAARKPAEEEAARKAAEEQAAKKAAGEQAAKKAAEERAAKQKEAQEQKRVNWADEQMTEWKETDWSGPWTWQSFLGERGAVKPKRKVTKRRKGIGTKTRTRFRPIFANLCADKKPMLAG